ncbi:hypothetical protein F5Y16DRAFT_203746 [Xylariaceae sp. FL0255]|nr:hypothetical protein F5Y16DRAFT_203746 [Xylariaceae sp. FL0255]
MGASRNTQLSRRVMPKKKSQNKCARKDSTKWDENKGTLRSLYMRHNFPLPRVMAIMKKQYGFDATPKQFRYQLTNIWGWKKYNQPNKESPVEEIDLSVPLEPDISSVEAPSEDEGQLLDLQQRISQWSGDTGPIPIPPVDFDDDNLALRDCIRLCAKDACVDEIMKRGAELPDFIKDPSDDTNDDYDDVHEWDSRLIVFLLDRLVASRASAKWYQIAIHQLRICPIYMLIVMTSLILTAANKRLTEGGDTIEMRQESSSTLWIASFGLPYIASGDERRERGLCWDAEQLVDEFKQESRNLTPDYVLKLRESIREYNYTKFHDESPDHKFDAGVSSVNGGRAIIDHGDIETENQVYDLGNFSNFEIYDPFRE